MADANVLDRAKSLIEDRLKEIDEERKRLEKALANIIGEHRGPRRARASRPRRACSRTTASWP